MKRHYYLCYGSNLNIRQMELRCPQAKPVGAVMLMDYELVFRGVATVEPLVGGAVPCGLWLITAEDEVALDIYEGWPRLYRKEMVTVQYGKRRLRVMTYVMNDGHPISAPSSGYYRTILEGYEDFGLDTAPLLAAVEKSRELSAPFRLYE